MRRGKATQNLYGPQNASKLADAVQAAAQQAKRAHGAADERRKLEDQLLAQILYSKLPAPAREHLFSTTRRWRFDFAYVEQMIAIEVEGGTWVEGAHSRGKHYESDCCKYNQAQLLGWRIYRFTTDMIADGRAIDTIEKALHL